MSVVIAVAVCSSMAAAASRLVLAASAWAWRRRGFSLAFLTQLYTAIRTFQKEVQIRSESIIITIDKQNRRKDNNNLEHLLQTHFRILPHVTRCMQSLERGSGNGDRG